MIEKGLDLFPGDGPEVVDELLDGRAVLEGIEEARHGQPGVLEDPGSAHFVGVTFDGITTVPVVHGVVSLAHGALRAV